MLSHTRSADTLPTDPPSSDVLRAPAHLRSARIIVADDDPGIVLVMKRLLHRAGYDGVIYTDRGAEVGMLCIEHDPDLVITDLRMPDRHGYEVVEDVRRLSGGAVPVLVVSGEERSVMMKKALACGARDFLSKPFEPAEALLRIRNLLDVRMLHKASLADAETRCRAMVEGASDLICQIDPAGQITYANRAGVALLGVELAGRRFYDLVHPDHRAGVRRFYCEQLKSGTACTSHEFPLVVDGVEFWLEHKVQLDVVDGRVRDLGRGIPEGKLESIFERFQQLDSSDSREKNGTGLGLSICRHLAAVHGGRVWAESRPGAGSTFTVLLPGAVAGR